MNCPTGKIEHQTVTAAQAHANSIFKKDGHQPNIYICSQCGFFHVGGGRASDRPAVRAAQTKTPWRERIPKPAPGKTLKVEELILNEFINSFKTDSMIAQRFGVTYAKVWGLRHELGVPRVTERQREIVRKILSANPSAHREKLAKKIPCSTSLVAEVVKEMGLVGLGRVNVPKRGPKHALFGQRATEEAKQNLKKGREPGWSDSRRAKISSAMTRNWLKPKYAAKARLNLKPDARVGKSLSEEQRKKIGDSVRKAAERRRAKALGY